MRRRRLRDATSRAVAPTPRNDTDPSIRPVFTAATLETFVIGEWDFEDGFGGPDAQGWSSLDAHAQADTFFHVDDFAGMSLK